MKDEKKLKETGSPFLSSVYRACTVQTAITPQNPFNLTDGF